MSRAQTPGGQGANVQRIDPRALALGVLEEVDTNDAYANLLLPTRLAESALSARDRGFATELVYGTLRWRRLYDELIGRAAKRDAATLDRRVLEILRLSAHQLLHMRVPAHAAVNEAVTLAKRTRSGRASGLINAATRRLSEHTLDEWAATLKADLPADRYLSVRWSHPEWIVRALRRSLEADGRGDTLEALLAADNEPPAVNLVALPGLADRVTLADTAPDALSPFGARLAHGDPAALTGRGVRVQDEGSQLAALALAAAPAGTPEGAQPEHWIDVCAGPGGKTALLAALAAQQTPPAQLGANEPVAHRAQLVRQALGQAGFADVAVSELDGAEVLASTEWQRALIDAPCTGLGALRRRPEARWRKQPGDLRSLTALQSRLIDAAVDNAGPGATIAYITCSPHLAETRQQVDAALQRHSGELEVIDAARVLTDAVGSASIDLGTGAPGVQLWPHIHATDGMFISLLRRR